MATSVSLCMIVRDEEAALADCLASVADLVQQILVVDTGSQDGTRDVAAGSGAEVIDFAWVDDFAAARNAGLEHARGQWIFWLDADERLDERNRDHLRNLIAGLKDANAAYLMQQLSLEVDGTPASLTVPQVRLFRNHPQIRWRYRVHEQILLAVREQGGTVRPTDVVIHHHGYANPAAKRQKLRRNLRLLELDESDHSDDPVIGYHLGLAYLQLGQHAQALDRLRRSLQRTPPGYSHRPRLYALLARCHQQLGQPREATAVCRDGLRQYPRQGELLDLQGLLYQEQGNLAAAQACWQQLLHARQDDPLAIDASDVRRRVQQRLA
jgi:glycosyltransferase involved in cell wall biosynthesis